MFYKIFAYIINALFPRECVRCKNRGALLCEECILMLPRAPQSTHAFITAIFDYHDPVIRKIIWKFKYKNARVVAKYFGGQLYDEIIGELSDSLHISKDEKFLLVPIPLHKKRQRERGYNQSELLAREIARYDTGKMFVLAPRALIRTRKTQAQAKSQKRAARFENLRGAFSAKVELVRGKHIILIDDVTTTGATLSEARKALLKAGAKTVKAYTVAH